MSFPITPELAQKWLAEYGDRLPADQRRRYREIASGGNGQGAFDDVAISQSAPGPILQCEPWADRPTAASEWQRVKNLLWPSLSEDDVILFRWIRPRWGDDGFTLLLDYPEGTNLDHLADLLNRNPSAMLELSHATGFNWGEPYEIEPQPEPAGPAPPPALADDVVGWLPTTEVMEALHRNEVGDAELLAKMYKDRIAYDHSERQWYLWNGVMWEPDRCNAVKRLVSGPLAAQYQHAGAKMRSKHSEEGGEDEKALWKRAASLRYRNRIGNVLNLAESQADLALTGDEWDRDPYLLGVTNGVLDLGDGILFFGFPQNYIRRAAPTTWEGLEAPAPRWELFLQEIFGGDLELIAFVQRLFGYGLTGLSTEHVLPVVWGEGRNGKDTLLETLLHVLGEVASPVGAEVMLSGTSNPNAASPHTYALRHLRLCWVSETSEGARLNAARVKMLCGGGTISARPLYGNPTTFKPKFLLMLMTNHKPHASSDDVALWKRLLLIPFTQTFVDNPDPDEPTEHKRDPDLAEKLKVEASGILAWLVRGCLEWQEQGLNPPEVVRIATQEYQDEEDTMALFLGECCVISDNTEVGAGELYTAYVEWAKSYGSKPMSNVAFGRRMKRKFKWVDRNVGRFYLGVGLRITE